jgi:hypothetical protein
VIADGEHRQQSRDEEQVARLVSALSLRLAEVLPDGEFEVTIDRLHAVRIRRVRSRRSDIVWLSPMALWQSRSPVEVRLQLFLDAAARRVQTFVSAGLRGRWPTVTAEPRVSIGQDSILVWWGGPCVADADVAIRPIPREEIGL